MTARARATIMTTQMATCLANRAIITFGKVALTTTNRRITRTTTTASVVMHEAKMDLRTMADGARGTIITIMMTIEIAIETAIDMAIGVPEVETGNLAKAIAKRCPTVQRHGLLIALLGHPLSVLTKLETPIAEVPGNLEVPALVLDDPEVPADAPASAQDPATVFFPEVPAWTLVKLQPCTHTVQRQICL